MRFDNNFVNGMLFSQAETKRNDAFSDASAVPSLVICIGLALCVFNVCENVVVKSTHNLYLFY